MGECTRTKRRISKLCGASIWFKDKEKVQEETQGKAPRTPKLRIGGENEENL